MTIRQILFILLLFIGYRMTANQDTLPDKIQVVATINCTKFAKQFLSLSNSTFDISPYLIGARVGFKQNWIRAQIGIDQNSNSNSDPNSTNKTSLSNNDMRFGYQREIKISNKFASFIGGDIMFNTFQNKTSTTSSSFSSIQNTLNSTFGLGLNFGVQWNITNKISIYTEAMIVSSSSSGSIYSKNESGGQVFESSRTIAGDNISYIAPTSIFFQFKF